MSTLLTLALVLGADPEQLSGRYRALTLGPGERRELHASGLERVTGASGVCIEEGMSADSVETMFVQANCASVRTTLAWLQKNVRIHILVCAEGEEREAAQVKRREKAQKEFKAWKGVTVCVRGQEVQLLGWAASPAEREKLAAKAKKLGLVDKVELLGEKEREGEDSAPGE